MNTHAKPSKLIKGATGDWEIVVGMEIHAQVNSRSKLFSGASTAFGGDPNSHVSLVDAAMPGMLPVINEECVKQAVRTGLGLKARINNRSTFDRKNYFYPDLPQGYQISQFKSPIVGEGEVIVDVSPTEQITVGIERLHLEQDAGKSLHDQSPTDSFVDLNRSGVALMEIVSKPDIRSADEARAYVTKLRTILRYIGSCDGDMEKGNLRADVNVSVRRPGEGLGTRCEIKNVNSIRFIGQAVETEARRQIAILEDGGSITQETRLFDPGRGETRAMRSKEEAHDYRYFPDPDLLPLEFDQAFVDALAAGLPELPDAKKARFMRDYGLPAYDAGVLVADRETADYYEAAVRHGGTKRDAKIVANWVTGDIAAYANSIGLSVAQTHITPAQIAGIVDLIGDGSISGKIAKDMLAIIISDDKTGDPRAIVEARGMKQVTDTGAIEAAVVASGATRDAKIVANWVTGDIAAYANSIGVGVAQTHITPAQIAGIVDLIVDGSISGKIAKDLLAIIIAEDKSGDPRAIVEARGMKQVTDTGAIEAAVVAIIEANPDKVAQARAKPTMLGWFVGQVMKQTGGKANPQAVNDLLKSKLGI